MKTWDKFYLLFDKEIEAWPKLIVYKSCNVVYKHKIHIYSLQYLRNGKKARRSFR